MDEVAGGSRERSCTIEQFTQMRPPSFAGGADPLVAENWLQDIEDMLTVLPCKDEKKVLFAMFKLTGDAKRWWRLARLLEEQRFDLVAVMWSCFKEIFFERYFLATIRSAKAMKFWHLTQGPMTIEYYVVRFVELSQFSPYLVPDEEKKARKFEKGLR
ncbi:uncharacterized protein LOC131145765 [Malania oleifera]|uniref:uncharacterized protein LOC131145765 n=1 Tax=Malania oleifera TaxID=397392 RepID=UPI0025AE1F9F|nr:uncharacterized protein LOC131145765 [Malania oleifera]